MPLEDELGDIIKKARTGQQRSVADVARAGALPEAAVSGLERVASLREVASRCKRWPVHWG